MFSPKKIIPALAGGALALTGCSGDGGSSGTGGSGGGIGAELAATLDAWCMNVVECFPGVYDSVQGCVNYITEYYDITGDLSPACEAAAASYFDCGAALTCAQLDAISNDCDDEYDAAGVTCG